MTTTTSCPIRWLVTGRPLLSWPRRCVICKIVSPFLLCVQGTLFIRKTTTKQQEPSRTTDERPIERLATTRRAGDGGGGFDCHWLSFSFFFFSLRQLHVESSRAQFSEIKEKVALVRSFLPSFLHAMATASQCNKPKEGNRNHRCRYAWVHLIALRCVELRVNNRHNLEQIPYFLPFHFLLSTFVLHHVPSERMAKTKPLIDCSIWR